MGLISSDEELSGIFKSAKEAAIPREVRLNEKVQSLNPIFNVGAFDPSIGRDALEENILEATRNAEAAVFLVEQRHLELVARVRSAFFIAPIEIADAKRNYKNFLGAVFARLLKNFAHLVNFMSRSLDEQAIILPLRNFRSPALENLRLMCETQNLERDFLRKIEIPISNLKDTRRPRKATTYWNNYFVDDSGTLFEYGKEKHARLPTGAPHFRSCEITGNFRFGKRITADRHFNVSREDGIKAKTKISGLFINCHDERQEIAETTHINMFSNDYH